MVLEKGPGEGYAIGVEAFLPHPLSPSLFCLGMARPGGRGGCKQLALDPKQPPPRILPDEIGFHSPQAVIPPSVIPPRATSRRWRFPHPPPASCGQAPAPRRTPMQYLSRKQTSGWLCPCAPPSHNPTDHLVIPLWPCVDFHREWRRHSQKACPHHSRTTHPFVEEPRKSSGR